MTTDLPQALKNLPDREYWESLSNDQSLQWLEAVLPFYRGTDYLGDRLEDLEYQQDLQIPDNFTDKQLDKLEELGDRERAEILAWLISRINPQEIMEAGGDRQEEQVIVAEGQ